MFTHKIFILYTKYKCRYPIHLHKRLHLTTLTCTSGNVQWDKMFLSGMRSTEAMMLHKFNHGFLAIFSLSSLLADSNMSRIGKQQTDSVSIALWIASSNSLWIGRAVSGDNEARSLRLWAVNPPESIRMPSSLKMKEGQFYVNRKEFIFALIDQQPCQVPNFSQDLSWSRWRPVRWGFP